MSVYVGMDVHRKRTQIAVLDGDGTELVNRNVDNGSEAMRELLEDLPQGTEVAFEAGYGWELGPRSAPEPRPRSAPRPPGRLPGDRLRTAQERPRRWENPRPPPANRPARRVLDRSGGGPRHALAPPPPHPARPDWTALKSRIHALLADVGLSPPSSLWTQPGRTWLAAQSLPEASQRVVEDCLAVIDLLAELTTSLEREIRSRYRPDPRVEALQQLPGVGPIIAMILVAEIGEISRFPSARKLCSWAGLTPTERSSDKTVRRGHISKHGPNLVRWALGEAAHMAKKRSPFAAFYYRVAKRRGTKIATVAVARKLLARSFHVLREVEVSWPGELAV